MSVSVQYEDFEVSEALSQLRQNPAAGALVSFVGLVRDMNDGEAVQALTLEHYPGMTEKALQAIEAEAKTRWDILDTVIVHRVGTLSLNDQIVLVAVSSAHRRDAFLACDFIMDYLKTQAPFWKKEQTAGGERWVEARIADDIAQSRWKTDKP
jgi:molybdopterin synthase catalytic subunit